MPTAEAKAPPAAAAPGQGAAAPPVLLFDGVCNLCNGAVNFVIERDRAGRFRFASLQSEVGRRLLVQAGLPADYLGSLVLVDEERLAHVRSDAALEVARRLDGWWPLGYHLFRWLPRPLRDGLYGVVAQRRYRWFGRRETCRLMTPALQARFLGKGAPDDGRLP